MPDIGKDNKKKQKRSNTTLASQSSDDEKKIPFCESTPNNNTALRKNKNKATI